MAMSSVYSMDRDHTISQAKESCRLKELDVDGEGAMLVSREGMEEVASASPDSSYFPTRHFPVPPPTIPGSLFLQSLGTILSPQNIYQNSTVSQY